jgi:hypothetical protein
MVACVGDHPCPIRETKRKIFSNPLFRKPFYNVSQFGHLFHEFRGLQASRGPVKPSMARSIARDTTVTIVGM